MHWIDRITSGIAPRWTLGRIRARAASEILARHYEAAATGRRTQGWSRSSGDANAAAGPALSRLRDTARDLVRNNPYCASALSTIADQVVSWGITPTPEYPRWQAWAETAACDADGRHDFYGLQKLVMRTVVESGECLIRRRWRRVEDGLPIPLQLQVIEPDYLDPLKDGVIGGNRIIQGIEFDLLGRRVAYHLFRQHPGAAVRGPGFGAASDRIPASEVLHVYRLDRPGQARGVSWFAPVILRLKDLDEYEDATLMKQKIAACLAVITSDVDGSTPPLGTATAESPEVDSLEPGMVLNLPPGRTVSTVTPPTVREHGEYMSVNLRAVATGLGLTYEDATGDYTDLPYSAARMSRLRHWHRVEDWRWRMLIPQFCGPVYTWAREAAGIVAAVPAAAATVRWTAPPAPMIEPDKEARAYNLMIRNGLQSLSESLRERGYDPDVVLQEIAADWKKAAALGLVLDSNPAQTTQQGGPRSGVDSTEPGDTAPALVGKNGTNGARHTWASEHPA